MNLLPRTHGRRAWTLLLMLALSFVSAAGAVEVVDGDALSLVITYRSTAANRAALRNELQTAGSAQFTQWQREGVIKNFRLLFNRYVDSANWDAMALLTFAHAADIERWTGLERSHTAGLTEAAMKLTSAVDTVPVDLVRASREAAAEGNPVFLVIPYEVLVSSEDYLHYADGYTLPQFDGWIAEGVLAGYRIYLSRYPAGRPWSSLIVLEYKSEVALAARNEVVAKVRAKLKDVPQWKAISDSKKNVREEKQVVVADELKPRTTQK